MQNIIVGALVVGIAVLGYFYYQQTKNDIVISPPKIETPR